MTTAQTIIEQLGGNKFIAMTGATNILADDRGVQFKIGRNPSKISHITISLTPADDYDMDFVAVHGTSVKNIAVANGVDAENIRRIFSEITGLSTSL